MSAPGAPPLRLGVVGLGRAFTLMLPTFTRDARVRLAAACDPRPQARAQFARDFAAPAFDTVEGLLAGVDLDAVYVASPAGLHAAHVAAVAAAGRHVLVEKPMALTLAECDAMAAACARAGMRLIVGHCHSFDAPYLEARRILDSGALGRVRMIHALNFTDFLYRPRRPDELDTAAGGGVVLSQAAHQVDVVRLLAGTRVLRVRAVAGAWDPARPTEGAYAALLWFEGGAFASLTYSGYAHFDSDPWMGDTGETGHRRSERDYGAARARLAALDGASEAAFKASRTYGGSAWTPASDPPRAFNHFGPVIVCCERGDLQPVPDAVWIHGDRARERVDLPPPRVPRAEVIDELCAAVDGTRAPLHDGAWGRATLEVCLALLESARSGRDVELAALALSGASAGAPPGDR